MSRLLNWDATGERRYEVGVSNAVIYPWDKTANGGKGAYNNGEAWNGISAINESPSGAEPTDIYADNIKYLTVLSIEQYASTIEAFTYPAAFSECNGETEIADGVFAKQQTRKQFGLCYKTILGNDTEENNYGYKLHLVYGLKASPSEENHETINDSPDISPLSWETNSTPVTYGNGKTTSVLVIDSTKVPAEKLAQLEDILYGKTAESSGQPTPARLPLPDEVISIIGKTQG